MLGKLTCDILDSFKMVYLVTRLGWPLSGLGNAFAGGAFSSKPMEELSSPAISLASLAKKPPPPPHT